MFELPEGGLCEGKVGDVMFENEVGDAVVCQGDEQIEK
jgi:hypothetical protein